MSKPEVRIYRSRRPLKTALTVFFVLLAVLVVLVIAIFFGFQKYIVYTSDGVKLEVPWLQDPEETAQTPGPEPGPIEPSAPEDVQ